MLYNVVLVSAIPQRESAICMHISPPSKASLPPPRPTPLGHQSTELSSLCYICGSICIPCYSLRSSHPFLPPLGPQIHSMSASRFLLSHEKNDIGSLVETPMDLESAIQGEGSQNEKNKISHVNTYMWNPEKWYRC